jgi:hypothetical protein
MQPDRAPAATTDRIVAAVTPAPDLPPAGDA